MRVRELLLRLRAQVDRAAEAMPNLLDRIAGLAAKALAALTAVGTAMAGLAIRAAHTADELRKTARDLRTTTAEVQALRLAAEMAGVGAEQLQVGLTTLRRQLGAAGAGSAQAAEALRMVGVSAADAERPVTETMARVLDGLKSIEDPARRDALAMVLLGEAGARMGSLIEGGSRGIAVARLELESMGIALTDVQAEAGEAAVDAMSLLQARVSGLATALGLRLAPLLIRVTELLGRVVAAGAPLAIRGIETAARLAGAALSFLETPLGMVVALLAGGLAAKGIATWLASIPMLSGALKVLGGLVSWTGAAIVGLGLVIEDLIVFVQGGESAFGRLIETMLGAEAVEDVRGIFIGIGEVIDSAARAALASVPSWQSVLDVLGSIASAAGTAYDALGRMVGVEGATARLRDSTSRIAAGVSSAGSSLGDSAREALSGARRGLESADRGFERIAATQNVSITVQGATGPEVARAIQRELSAVGASAIAGAR